MSSWGPSTYGDPCRECGFDWSMPEAAARKLVAEGNMRYRLTLRKAHGSERHPDLGWTIAGYVAHVADNLAIWAERMAGVARGTPTQLAGYDENELAAARRYNELTLPGTLWSMEHAARNWLSVIDAVPDEMVMTHPERGEIRRVDVKRANAHDLHHHLWDIIRILEVQADRAGDAG